VGECSSQPLLDVLEYSIRQAEALTLHIHLHDRFSIQILYMRIVKLFMSKINSNYPIVQFVVLDGATFTEYS